MAKKKPEQRAKQRIGVTLQLYVGDDDDLIKAIAELPDGGRNSALKTVLRQALGMPLPEPNRDEIEALKSEVLIWREQSQYQDGQLQILRDRINELEQSPVVPVQAVGFDDLENLRLSIHEEITKALNTPYTPPAPPSVQAADQLDSRIANERKNRLKGADW